MRSVLLAVITSIVLLISIKASGHSRFQSDSLITIQSYSPTIQGLVPVGWLIEFDTIAALLANRSHARVLVLKQIDTSEWPQADRILIIVEDRGKDGYYVLGQNSDLIEPTESGMLHFGDPRELLSIDGQVLTLRNSWLNGDAFYKFRFDSIRKRFMLIGFECFDAGRNGTPHVSDSRNYLTGKRQFKYGPWNSSQFSKSATVKLRHAATTLEDTKRDDYEIDNAAITKRTFKGQLPENTSEQ
jgi:hypothetical protein